MPPDVRVRRIYEPPDPADGFRVLVDRLWPRGVRRDAAPIDAWMPELGPSTELRRWFGHDLARWPGFVERYRAELAEPTRAALLQRLEERARVGPVTILGAAKDIDHSNAAVVAAVLRERLVAA